MPMLRKTLYSQSITKSNKTSLVCVSRVPLDRPIMWQIHMPYTRSSYCILLVLTSNGKDHNVLFVNEHFFFLCLNGITPLDYLQATLSVLRNQRQQLHVYCVIYNKQRHNHLYKRWTQFSLDWQVIKSISINMILFNMCF